MKIVNITDIEELITTKIEIDNLLITHKDREEKMKLEDYMKEYCTLDKYSYMFNDYVYPFQYKKVYNNEYLFVTDINNEVIEKISKFLKRINYNINNTSPISMKEVASIFEDPSKTEIIIHDGKYYSL